MMDIENNTGKIQTIDNSKFFRILKSNFLLMLYNLVEACVVSGMLEIYESLKQSQSGYNELIEEIQSLWSKYKIGEIYKSSGTRSSYEKGVREIIAQVITDEPVFLNRAALEISGNLDARRIDELELMLGVFPDVIAGVRKSARKIADEIKNLRVDIVHGHAYYYDFANDHNIQYYMLMLDKLIERMNLKLVGFNDEEIKTFRPY